MTRAAYHPEYKLSTSQGWRVKDEADRGMHARHCPTRHQMLKLTNDSVIIEHGVIEDWLINLALSNYPQFAERHPSLLVSVDDDGDITAEVYFSSYN